MSRPNSNIDWDLVEKLGAIQCTLLDVAIALGISDAALRRAVNRDRPDLVLGFAQARAVTRTQTQTQATDRARELGRKIAEVLSAHKAERRNASCR